MKLYLALPAFAIVLTGCIEKDAQSDGLEKSITSIKEVKINADSPDMTVKSWWRLRDAAIILDVENCKFYLRKAADYSAKVSQLSTDSVHTGPTCEGEPLTFDRQITNVDVQSDTRAVVTAQIKNTTPPEKGSTLESADKKAKEAGAPYRYILEREEASGPWKISKVLTMPSYADTWEEVFTAPLLLNHRWVYETYQ
ncbi:hypothetical protein [Pseudomonas putida]|uniref:hypothetical protein n=1 Tax=Pseudomonas putida TaxID=303 RepID=UPI0039058E05